MRRAVLFAVDGDAARPARRRARAPRAIRARLRRRVPRLGEGGTHATRGVRRGRDTGRARARGGGSGRWDAARSSWPTRGTCIRTRSARSSSAGGSGAMSATGDAISEATVHGHIDHYLVRPLEPPDEAFHQAISSFLLEWAEDQRVAPHAVRVVGDAWSGRGYELRSVLERCALSPPLLARRLARGSRRTRRSDAEPAPAGGRHARREGIHESLRSRAVAGKRLTPCTAMRISSTC